VIDPHFPLLWAATLRVATATAACPQGLSLHERATNKNRQEKAQWFFIFISHAKKFRFASNDSSGGQSIAGGRPPIDPGPLSTLTVGPVLEVKSIYMFAAH